MKSRLPFQIDAKAEDSRARAARIQTLHGELTTPVFMPVGTQATVKGQTRESLEESGAQIVLANTYHLMLRPGQEVFERFGGIHRFMGWEKPVLTDSGGYQVYSLAGSRRIDEEGATFESYVDCRSTRINPEISIGMQRSIGSDIMMAFDQCIDARAGGREAREAMGRTHR
ncbi:MAG: tRNA-guanine transglycosylase, partial [Bdellovibrionota bacterium]